MPWSNRKSRRGAKKRINTDGLACLNPTCAYFGIPYATIHALVGNSKRGNDRDIQYLKCQCCNKAFTSRKGTPLYYLKSKTGQVEMVLWFLAEGVDLSVMVLYTGKADATLARWLDRMGEHSSGLHDIFFQGLLLGLVQLDELYVRVRDEQKALPSIMTDRTIQQLRQTCSYGQTKRTDKIIHVNVEQFLIVHTDSLSFFHALCA